MKVAVIGGTGFIGSRLVEALNISGQQAVPHSRSTGVDIVSGANVDKAVAGADVVINVTDAPSFDDAAFAFFQTSMDNLLRASAAAGVGHFVLLSIVGIDQVPAVAYYRAKVLQENILAAGPVPYTIVRATQFMEFVDAILAWTSDGDVVRLPRTPMQPIATTDVISALVDVATSAPANGTVNIAGADVYPLDELGRLTLAANHDGRAVVSDDAAGLFAAVPGNGK